jgi:hypothetical protein
MRPAQRAACLYKTAPAIHRLLAPRCPGAEVAFLVERPALHFFAAVFCYVTGKPVRPAHAEAKTVRVANLDLAHLFIVRAAPEDALPDGAQQRIHLPSSDCQMKMQGATGLFLNDRYIIMKLFMLTELSAKRLADV